MAGYTVSVKNYHKWILVRKLEVTEEDKKAQKKYTTRYNTVKLNS